jgi:parvulin-like peptidyl-prolyl isomerase
MRSNAFIFLSTIFMILLGSCSNPEPAPIISPSNAPPSPTLTVSPVPPSPTPVPLAATVNGEEITLAEFQDELKRYQAEVGTELATEAEQRVLNELIDQLLLAQGAAEAGYLADEKALQERINGLATQLGGEQALKDWMASNGYDETGFRQSLARSLAAAWMRDQITAGVPEVAEQVHTRQILLYNSEEADRVLAQLSSGTDFADLAAEYDPSAGGDLGWFPRGYLLDPKLDEAAFSLQPGEFSQVIQTAAGYHIMQVVEREPDHPLEYGARQALQRRTLSEWLAERRSQSQIQVFVP